MGYVRARIPILWEEHRYAGTIRDTSRKGRYLMALDAKYGEVTLQENFDLSESSEPVFIVRAQDALALQIIRDYRYAYTDAYGEDSDSNFVDSLERVYEVFEEWQDINKEKVKKPD